MEIMVASKYTNNFDLELAIPIALLHDTIEDTGTTYEEIKNIFGKQVADGVKALTKNDNEEKSVAMKHSLGEIKKLSQEVWAVKLADRITNLLLPPHDWDFDKRKSYLKEAEFILTQLKGGNEYLEKRLQSKIDNYYNYCIQN